MFIYSVRAKTLKLFGVIALAVVLVIGIMALSGSEVQAGAREGINFGSMKDNDDRVAFIEGCGIKVKEAPYSTVEFSVPENFDAVIEGYNRLQKMQGLNIERYKNKKVTRYTYEAVEYGEAKESVFVNLIVFRNRIIACDVSSKGPEGFIKPLVNIDGQ